MGSSDFAMTCSSSAVPSAKFPVTTSTLPRVPITVHSSPRARNNSSDSGKQQNSDSRRPVFNAVVHQISIKVRRSDCPAGSAAMACKVACSN